MARPWVKWITCIGTVRYIPCVPNDKLPHDIFNSSLSSWPAIHCLVDPDGLHRLQSPLTCYSSTCPKFHSPNYYFKEDGAGMLLESVHGSGLS